MAARVQNGSAFAQTLRDLVNAIMSFEALAGELHKPTMSNLSAVFAAIQRALKVERSDGDDCARTGGANKEKHRDDGPTPSRQA